jgi:hypothetical protein
MPRLIRIGFSVGKAKYRLSNTYTRNGGCVFENLVNRNIAMIRALSIAQDRFLEVTFETPYFNNYKCSNQRTKILNDSFIKLDELHLESPN